MENEKQKRTNKINIYTSKLVVEVVWRMTVGSDTIMGVGEGEGEVKQEGKGGI